tara:strand:- start:562 stop:717 length:156 start_codon:yes stop_codon:yes gene_type:complete
MTEQHGCPSWDKIDSIFLLIRGSHTMVIELAAIGEELSIPPIGQEAEEATK